MKRQGQRLWKCNKVVFLECGKQIRLKKELPRHTNRKQTWAAAAVCVYTGHDSNAASLMTVTRMQIGGGSGSSLLGH